MDVFDTKLYTVKYTENQSLDIRNNYYSLLNLVKSSIKVTVFQGKPNFINPTFCYHFSLKRCSEQNDLIMF